jgi:hypothetical protein
MWKSFQLHLLRGKCQNLESALAEAMVKGNLNEVKRASLHLA